jgi:plasmid stabilization system protein ParE
MVKKYRVVVSQEARESLRSITDYVRRRESDSRARYVRDELLKAVDRLVTLPNSHPELRVSKTNITYRYLSKWKYKIIFTVQEDKDRVVVVRLYHDRQSMKKLEELLP